MSQALDLLNGLSEEDIMLLSEQNEESHIIVGKDRFISVPPALRRVAVQFDHDIETVTFDCPRYWDDKDMSKMAIYVNYMRADGYKDQYPVDNVQADGDIMHFDWTISKNVTPVIGRVSFLVCVVNTDAEGNEINHWNSELNQEMYVSEGLECEESEIINDPDLVSQLLVRMAAVERINVTEGEITEALAAATEAQVAAEAARDIALDETNQIKNSYANAVKGYASGEIVKVDDVSPVEHDVNVKVRSKNLIRFPFSDTTKTASGATFTVNEQTQSVTVTGTPEINVSFAYTYGNSTAIAVSKGKTYTASCDSTFTGDEYIYVAVMSNGVSVQNITLKHDSVTFTALADGYISAGLVVRGGNTYNNTVYFQLEEGDTATDYEPYIDPSTMGVVRCGKAVFSKPSQTVSGVEKPWTSLLVAAVQVPPGVYTAGCRFNQVGPDISRVSISARSYNDYKIYLGNDEASTQSGNLTATFTVAPGDGGFQLFLYSNVPNEALTTECVFENIYVVPGSTASGYSVYNGAKFTPNTDGTVDGVTSLAPNMTIYAESEGVLVEAEYTRDTNKVVSDLAESIGSSDPTTGVSLSDTTTGKLYTLYVSNGKLMLAESEV